MKTFLKKWSLLGLLLMAASALAAAILPENRPGKKPAFNGSLHLSSAGEEYTCDITDDIGRGCFASTGAGSVTTITDSSSGTAATTANTTLDDIK